MSARFWVGVAAAAHVSRGVEEGFAMFAHGSHAAIKRLRPGDWVTYYAPREQIDAGSPVRAFVAIGEVAPGEPFQRQMGESHTGWSRAVRWLPAKRADVYPLLGPLSFVRDPAHWGIAFRRSLFQVSRDDFALIADAMGVGEALPPAQE